MSLRTPEKEGERAEGGGRGRGGGKGRFIPWRQIGGKKSVGRKIYLGRKEEESLKATLKKLCQGFLRKVSQGIFSVLA